MKIKANKKPILSKLSKHELEIVQLFGCWLEMAKFSRALLGFLDFPLDYSHSYADMIVAFKQEKTLPFRKSLETKYGYKKADELWLAIRKRLGIKAE